MLTKKTSLLLYYIGIFGIFSIFLYYKEINPIVWIQQFKTQSTIEYEAITIPLIASTYTCNECVVNEDCTDKYGWNGLACLRGVCLPNHQGAGGCHTNEECLGGDYVVQINQLLTQDGTSIIDGGPGAVDLGWATSNASGPGICYTGSNNYTQYGGACHFPVGGIAYDNGETNTHSRNICFCGNGVIESTAGEQCDGSQNCSSSCQCDEGYSPESNGSCVPDIALEYISNNPTECNGNGSIEIRNIGSVGNGNGTITLGGVTVPFTSSNGTLYASNIPAGDYFDYTINPTPCQGCMNQSIVQQLPQGASPFFSIQPFDCIECPNAASIIPQLTQGAPGCPGELFAGITPISGFTAGRYDSNGNEIAAGWTLPIDMPGNYTLHFQINNSSVSPSLFCDYYPTIDVYESDFFYGSNCPICGNSIEDEGEQCDGGAYCNSLCTCEVGYTADPNNNGCVQKIFTPPVLSPLDPSTYTCGQCQSNNDCNTGEVCKSSMCLPSLVASCNNDNECYGGPLVPNQLLRSNQTSKITKTTIASATIMECNLTISSSQGQCYLQGYNGIQGRDIGGNVQLCHCGNGIVEQGTNEQCDGSPNCTTSCQCAPGYVLNQSGNGCAQVQNNEPQVTYARETGNRSLCSEQCDGGTQTRNVVCTNSAGVTVSDGLCSSVKPPITQTCNTQSCPDSVIEENPESIVYSRHHGDFGQCTKECGGGLQSRWVECRDQDGFLVADSFCPTTIKPITTQTCNIQACNTQINPETINTYSRYIGEFSVCDKQCGGGTRTRLVECRDQNDTPVANTLCPGTTPPSTETCNTQACPVDTNPEVINTYSRYHGSFGQCTKECGGGLQSRWVECRDQDGLMVEDSFCPAITKPLSSQVCNMQACIEGETTKPGSWMIGAFGSCDKQCGGGTQTRTVLCKDEDGKLLSDSLCPTPKPTTQQSCNAQPCATTTTPDTIETYKRKEGDWGKCSKECGGGAQTRSVVCTNSTGKTVEDDLCPGTKPATKQPCNTQACIINGSCDIEFGLCEAGTLGNGNFYSCGDSSTWTCFGQGLGSTNANCSIENDPCNKQYRRNATQSGGCSELCEGGVQQWKINCIDIESRGGEIVDEKFCVHLPKPPTETECNPHRCTQFTRKTESWSQCSQTCGGGGQTRLVTCVNERGNTVAESFCADTPKPISKQTCNTHPCPEDVDPTLSCGPKHKYTFDLTELKAVKLLHTNDFCLNLPNTEVKISEITKEGVIKRTCPYTYDTITMMTPCEAYIKVATCGYADQQQYQYFFNGSERYPTAFCAEEGAIVTDYKKTETGRTRGCTYPGLKTTTCEAYRQDLICEEKVMCECTLAYTPPGTPPTPPIGVPLSPSSTD